MRWKETMFTSSLGMCATSATMELAETCSMAIPHLASPEKRRYDLMAEVVAEM